MVTQPSPSSPERGLERTEAAPSTKVAVIQPKQIQSILVDLDAIEKITESVSTGRDGDWSSSGSHTGTQARKSQGSSARDAAIAKIPDAPAMQIKLKKHIHKEIRALRKEVRKVESLSKPGAAHKLNELYARIRRLHALVSELAGSSVDVLKRLFIRVFIDRQTVL